MPVELRKAATWFVTNANWRLKFYIAGCLLLLSPALGWLAYIYSKDVLPPFWLQPTIEALGLRNHWHSAWRLFAVGALAALGLSFTFGMQTITHYDKYSLIERYLCVFLYAGLVLLGIVLCLATFGLFLASGLH